MKFLLDENLSPTLATLLSAAGHEAVHISGLGMRSAPDPEVFDVAVSRGCTLISADTDFGALLAIRHTAHPSLLLLRRAANRRASEQARLILDNLATVAGDLAAGAVVVLGERTIRIRHLPL